MLIHKVTIRTRYKPGKWQLTATQITWRFSHPTVSELDETKENTVAPLPGSAPSLEIPPPFPATDLLCSRLDCGISMYMEIPVLDHGFPLHLQVIDAICPGYLIRPATVTDE